MAARPIAVALPIPPVPPVTRTVFPPRLTYPTPRSATDDDGRTHATRQEGHEPMRLALRRSVTGVDGARLSFELGQVLEG
jgi:hypothetical protein